MDQAARRRRVQFCAAVAVLLFAAGTALYAFLGDALVYQLLSLPYCTDCRAWSCPAPVDYYMPRSPPKFAIGNSTSRDVHLYCADRSRRLTSVSSSSNSCHGDLQLFTDSVGPASYTVKGRSLVAMSVGDRGWRFARDAILLFGTERFHWILFVFDAALFERIAAEPWSSSVVVVIAKRQMKWWYIKRYVTPTLAASYDYIWLWDDDASRLSDLGFDPVGFETVMRDHSIQIAQPAIMTEPPEKSYDRALRPNSKRAGRFVHFIEVQFPVLSPTAYKCLWEFMPRDHSSGFGIDVFLFQMCGWVGRFAVIDKYPVFHGDVPTSGFGYDRASVELAELTKWVTRVIGFKPYEVWHSGDTLMDKYFG